MENLIFSMNATVPIFILMVFGYLFNKIGWMDDTLSSKLNTFVFKVSLPMLVFVDLAEVNIREAWNPKFVLFCFIATILSIILVTLISFLFKDKSIQGEFIQASYRSSAALLGIAFIQNIYGNVGMAPMMIIGSVPLYNIMAVVILSVFKKDNEPISKAMVIKTVKGILTNPIIVGIACGLLWSVTGIKIPTMVEKALSKIGGTATPMGLMAMGATFDIKKAFGKLKPSCTAAFIKLILLAAIFLPIAVKLGFRESELIAILVMLGSATTVSSFVMSISMGHEGVLSASVVMLTTLFSAFTLTLWLYILKTMALI